MPGPAAHELSISTGHPPYPPRLPVAATCSTKVKYHEFGAMHADTKYINHGHAPPQGSVIPTSTVVKIEGKAAVTMNDGIDCGEKVMLGSPIVKINR